MIFSFSSFFFKRGICFIVISNVLVYFICMFVCEYAISLSVYLILFFLSFFILALLLPLCLFSHSFVPRSPSISFFSPRLSLSLSGFYLYAEPKDLCVSLSLSFSVFRSISLCLLLQYSFTARWRRTKTQSRARFFVAFVICNS